MAAAPATSAPRPHPSESLPVQVEVPQHITKRHCFSVPSAASSRAAFSRIALALLDTSGYIPKHSATAFRPRASQPSDPKRESTMEDRWLSVDEVAAYLGVKRDTIYT